VSRTSVVRTQVGRYQILSELGRGSMGVVLMAHDPTLERNVALKYLRPDLRLTAEEREALMTRMRHEARAMARVSHPGIVSLFDMGEEEGVGVYLVFELADGPTLEETLKRGKLAAEGAARLATDLGAALSRAHNAGIVHRDIKPANIIFTEFGARVADFGVARLPESTLTRAGAKVGTPAYSAPESIRHGSHSPATDQFAMAATLYEALSGRRAFSGDDAIAVARKIESEAPLGIAHGLGLSPSVDRVLLRGLAQSALERYPSCAALGEALARALGAPRTQQPTMPDQRSLAPRQGRVGRLGGFLVCLLIGATLGVVLGRTRPAPAPKAETSKAGGSKLGAVEVRPAFLSRTPAPAK
jgi:eukaryotic-like serine/threonine-protein kinase